MSPFRILIVDDQTDVRRVLQVGIETLGAEYQVQAMPSAEEALLEASRQPVDLLVTDFRLPGMSGSELVSKMKRYCPDMKVFIITGMTDPNVHRQVKEAKPDDFFIKPVPLGDFLTAVKQTLDKVEKKPIPGTKPAADGKETHDPRVDELLAGMRKELEAEAVALLDRQGKTLSAAGKLPINLLSTLPASLAGLMETTGGLEQALGAPLENRLLFFKGKFKNLYAAQTGEGQALILVEAASSTALFSDPAVQMIFRTLEEISALESQGKTDTPNASPEKDRTAAPLTPGPGPQKPAESSGTVEPKTLVETEVAPDELKKVEEHFEQVSKKRPAPQQVEEFLEAAMEDDEARRARRPNDINYDEARRLGLAPEEDTD